MGKRHSRMKAKPTLQYSVSPTQDVPDVRCHPPVHKDSVKSVCPAGSGTSLSGGSDQTLVLYKWDDVQLLQKWIGHEREITKVVFSEKLVAAFSASRDKTARMWQRSGEVGSSCLEATQKYVGHGLVVTGLAVDARTRKLCTGSRDNFVHLWDIDTGDCIKQSGKSRNLVTHITWVPNEYAIAQTSEDKSLRLWDTRTLQETQIFPRKQYIQSHCDVSQDGLYAVTCSNGVNGQGCEATLWDLRTTKLLNEYRGHQQAVGACVFLPWNRGEQLIATCSNDCTAKIWEQRTCKCLCTVPFPGAGPLSSIAAYADGSLVISSYNSGLHIIQLEELQSGEINAKKTAQF